MISNVQCILFFAFGALFLVMVLGEEQMFRNVGEQLAENPKRKCYQCSYSPDRTVFEKIDVVRKIRDPKSGQYSKVKEKKTVPVKKRGGWSKCGGAITEYDAVKHGIDTWDCDGNCYVRVDKSNNLFRGCYRGEFGVNPLTTGVIQNVGDSKYRFCSGQLCNNYDIKY